MRGACQIAREYGAETARRLWPPAASLSLYETELGQLIDAVRASDDLTNEQVAGIASALAPSANSEWIADQASR